MISCDILDEKEVYVFGDDRVISIHFQMYRAAVAKLSEALACVRSHERPEFKA